MSLRDHILQVQLAAHICVLVNRHVLQNLMGIRAVGHSGILVPQGIYIHIDILVNRILFIYQ